jgi:NAD-dependent DNA ligase
MEQAAKYLRLDGFGEATCTLLHDRLKIKYIWELLQNNYEREISYLPGFTDYSARLLYTHVCALVGSVYDYEVVAALCIPGIGLELSKKLMQKYTYEQVFFDDNWSDAELLGPTRTQWIIDAKSTMRDNIAESFNLFKSMRVEFESSKGKICLSGKFDKPKQFYKTLIENAGYEYVNSMSSDVNMLVVCSNDQHSNKTEYALQHNIPILSIEQLLHRLGDSNV